MRHAALLLTVLAAAAPAGAQSGNPLGPLPPPVPETPTVVVAPDNDGEDGLESWQELLIFGGGAILLGGIAWAIISDARRRAPVRSEAEMAHPGLGGAMKRNRSAKQRQRSRAQARQARRQRKRNRRR